MTHGSRVANESYNDLIRLGWEVISVSLIVLDETFSPEDEMHKYTNVRRLAT